MGLKGKKLSNGSTNGTNQQLWSAGQITHVPNLTQATG